MNPAHQQLFQQLSGNRLLLDYLASEKARVLEQLRMAVEPHIIYRAQGDLTRLENFEQHLDAASKRLR